MIEKTETRPTQDSAAAILAIIDKTASDPACDVSKIEKLLTFHHDLVERNASQAYNEAMSQCQAQMPAVVSDSNNIQTHSKYAKFENIIINTKPVYTAHGFAVSFGTSTADKDGNIRITAETMHSAGHSKHYHLDLPPDIAGIKGSINKTSIHASASTFSYGKRYLFCMIFNIAIVGEDNDGNRAPVVIPAFLTETQARTIGELCKSSEKEPDECVTYLNKKFNTSYVCLAKISIDHAQHMIERLQYSIDKKSRSDKNADS